MIIDKGVAKAYLRLQRWKNQSKPCGLEATALDSKLARTFTDDVDIYHGLQTRRNNRDRPGQRDDESRCAYGRMIPVF